MDSADRSKREVGPPKTGDKGLEKDAVGFLDAVVIRISSTSPAYSLAVAIGLLVVTVGGQAPAVILVSFVPMCFVATAFYYMNRADQDCGTGFSWTTRALGPWAGWMVGWAMIIANILVIGSFADVAARYAYLVFGLEGLAGSKAAVTILAVVLIAVITAIAVKGIELSSRVENIMLAAQVAILLLFASVALVKVFAGSAPDGSVVPEASWFSPFEIRGSGALVGGLLIGVFLFWGWEVSVAINEETKNSASTPGLAAIVSTIALFVTYLSVAVAVIAFAGTGTAKQFADDDAILSTVATAVLGSPLDKLVALAVATAALAGAQAVALLAARISLSMAKARALPVALGNVHPRFLTPHVSTVVIGVLSVLLYVVLNTVSPNFLYDSLSGMALLVVAFYALIGLTCVIYYRKELFKSAKNFIFVGVIPLIGSAVLFYAFFESLFALADPSESYTGASLFGLGLPLAIAFGSLGIGAILMVLWNLLGDHRRFFSRRLETVDPKVAAGRADAAENVGTTSAP